MSKHISTVHENSKTMDCELCGKSFSSKNRYIGHLSNFHEKKYTCDLCDKRFGYRGILSNHVATIHEGRTITLSRFPCKICLKTFTRKHSIRQHMSSVHEGKKYTCSSCGKDLSEESSLRRHINLIHEGKGPKFECHYENCDYVTNYKQQILAHKISHDKHMGFIYKGNSKRKDYKCDICENTFSSTKGLKKHYQKHKNFKKTC